MSQEEDEYWEARILEVRRGQVETVRKSAAIWLTLFTAVLGVFTTVTFAAGLAGLNDLASTTRNVVRTGVAVAVVATLAATVLAGSAANSWPRRTSDLTVDAFRTRAKRQAAGALARLRWAMACGAVAAVVVVAGALVVVFADKQPAKPPLVVVTVNGKTYCGPMTAQPDGTLAVGAVSLNGATSLATVATCS